MAYSFGVQSVSRRYIDDAIQGAVIAIRCENEDTGGLSHLTWFAPTSDFPAWPPTREQEKTYMVSYLQASAPGSSISRAEQMRLLTPIIRDDPETWSEEDKELIL